MKIEMTQEDYNAFMVFKTLGEEKKFAKVTEPPYRKRRVRGTGTVYKLTGTRIRPWVARICLGKNADGITLHENIGYFKTEQEAKVALDNYAQFGRSSERKITFEEVWDHVEKETVMKKSKSAQTNYCTAYNRFAEIDYKPINMVTLHDLQPIFDREMAKGSGTSKLSNMKTVCKLIYQYAIKYDYTDKDYSQYITYESTTTFKLEHKSFTHDEIITLFDVDTYESRLILIYIYTGLRPQELMAIYKTDVHLNDGYMVGGLKTENGRNRVIPLHDVIKPYIQELLEQDGSSVLPNFHGKYGVDKYRAVIFSPLMKKLEFNHLPYDTRHTFATLCEEYGLNDYLVKKIMGHRCNDLTKDVYTHATIERLVIEINKLPDFRGNDHE